MDPLTIAISGGLGALAGALILYFIIGGRKTRYNDEKPIKTLNTFEGQRLVERNEMEKARKDLNSILLEKDLISSALTRVYEAEVDGRISRHEREELSSRYKKRLTEVEENLGDAEITIEVGELERLREELVNLFEKKMSQLDNKLQDARVKLDNMKKSIEPEKTVKILQKKPREKKIKINNLEMKVDDKVKALREEVLEALARLEQMDIET
jgi:hypothetical protein